MSTPRPKRRCTGAKLRGLNTSSNAPQHSLSTHLGSRREPKQPRSQTQYILKLIHPNILNRQSSYRLNESEPLKRTRLSAIRIRRHLYAITQYEIRLSEKILTRSNPHLTYTIARAPIVISARTNVKVITQHLHGTALFALTKLNEHARKC